MAIEPVEYGEKVTVAGNEGVVVRSVAVRGGIEYLVRVSDDTSVPVKLPQPYNADAAFGVDDPDVYEEQNKAEKKNRKALVEAERKDRERYLAENPEESTVDEDDEDEEDTKSEPAFTRTPTTPTKTAAPSKATNSPAKEEGKFNR